MRGRKTPATPSSASVPLPLRSRESASRSIYPALRGSAADVRAKGVWRDGRWTLELERKLSTGHPDDAAFAPGRAIKMAAATFDRTGDMDRASGAIELSLGAGDASAPASPGGTTARTWSFDADRGGGTPAGFSFSRTGGGPPGRWIVRAEADAPSRPNVLAQAPDDTDVRFPIAAADGVSLLNLRLSVRCRPISGRVDQACGLVFRYRDENNYYITRANPLENNIRLYTVKDGRRRQIASWSGTVTANAWHDYAVEVRGDHIQVFWDGTKVLDHHDSTFTAPGGVGVWTKADSIVYFDDLLLGAALMGSERDSTFTRREALSTLALGGAALVTGCAGTSPRRPATHHSRFTFRRFCHVRSRRPRRQSHACSTSLRRGLSQRARQRTISLHHENNYEARSVTSTAPSRSSPASPPRRRRSSSPRSVTES